MDDDMSKTPQSDSVETGDQPAIPPTNDPGAATDDDQKVTLSKEDYNNLISQRDKNHERSRQTEYQVAVMLQKEDIKEFLSENKEKFPDVKVEDLLDADTPEEFERYAGQTQARIDDAAQRRLGDLQRVQTPTLTPQEKAAEMKKLKDNPGSQSFQKFLDLQQQ